MIYINETDKPLLYKVVHIASRRNLTKHTYIFNKKYKLLGKIVKR